MAHIASSELVRLLAVEQGVKDLLAARDRRDQAWRALWEPRPHPLQGERVKQYTKALNEVDKQWDALRELTGV